MTAKTKSSTPDDKKKTLICPFLGFEEDPSTALAYPTKYNYCYKAKPIAPVSLAHQRLRCLTDSYTECPVFQREETGPLPKEIRGERTSKLTPVRWVPYAALILVILIALIGAILTGILPVRGFSPPYMIVNIATMSAEPPKLTATPWPGTPTPQPTATIALTETPKPTLTQRPPLGLETPFGDSPELVIHKVPEGVGFIRLAENFNTTVDAIKAINFEIPDSLKVDMVLVIPMNTDDVSGLPMFKTHEVKAEGLTIEALSERMGLDVTQMKKYNRLPAGANLKLGEWLIIPVVKE